MGARKPELRRQARALRQEGWALRCIANEVNVALSTVSLWVRDIPGAAASPPVELGVEAESGGDSPVSLEVRRCGKCLRDLPLTSFNRHPTGHQWWCRECFRDYFRGRAKQHRRDVRAARRNRRQVAREFLADYLRTRSCADCGETDPRVLEFHHLEEKRGNVSDLVRLGSSLRLLERELAGCTVLCGNCHRLRTAASVGSWRLDPGRLERDRQLTAGERRNLTYVRDVLLRSECVDCADSRLVVLEFDHRGGKEGNVVELARRGCRLSRLEAEAARCEVRCVNCHRRRTAAGGADDPARGPTHEAQAGDH